MKLMQLPPEVREQILISATHVIGKSTAGSRNLVASWNEVLSADYADPNDNAVPGSTVLPVHKAGSITT